MMPIIGRYFHHLSEKSQQNIHTVLGDMTNFSLHEKFKLISIPFRSFQSLKTDEQALQCLSCVIKNANGIKIGYVPNADNEIFARLMDAGKLLFGKITSKDIKGNWLKINIKIYLHE